MKRKLPSQKTLHRLFRYDPKSGTLFWNRRDDVPEIWNRKCAGRLAGSLDKGGTHLRVGVFGKLVYVHRVIWKMVKGTEPLEVDHKDRNSLNNRIGNLRPATRSQNCINRHYNKASGLPRGVYFHKATGKFAATIKTDGKRLYLGVFGSVAAAQAAYLQKSRELHGEFARHY